MIKLETENLYKALYLLRDIIPQDNTHPILTCVKMSVNDKELTLQGKDIGKHGSYTIPILESSGEEDVVIPFTEFYRQVGIYKQNGTMMAIKVNKSSVVLFDEDNGKTPLPTMDVSKFPSILEPGTDKFNVVPVEIASLLSLGEYADPKSDRLSCIHIKSDGKTLEVEATNAYAGAYGSIDITFPSAFDIAVPASIRGPIMKMLKDTEGDDLWKMSVSDNFVFIEYKTSYIGFNLLNGSFPQMENMYKNSSINEIEVNVEDMIYRLSAVSGAISDNVVILEMKNGKLLVTNGSNSTHTLERDYEGEQDNKISLNLFTLNKILRNLTEKEIVMRIGKNSAEPFLIFEDDIIYFALPFTRRS